MTGMVDDPDNWRAASLLLKRHSADAEIVRRKLRRRAVLAHGEYERRFRVEQV